MVDVVCDLSLASGLVKVMISRIRGSRGDPKEVRGENISDQTRKREYLWKEIELVCGGVKVRVGNMLCFTGRW